MDPPSLSLLHIWAPKSLQMVTQFSWVQSSHLVVSNSLRPHDSQHARPPCPSPTPRVHSDSHPSMKLRHLYLGRKVMTNLDSIFKIRDITLSTKVCLVMAMVFPVVMYGCESWTVKKAKCRRIDAFEVWCWRRLLRVPWTARRSNQSILNEISPSCSLEGWCWSWKSNILATWCEVLTHLKRSWCWERLKAGGEGDNRGWDGWMASPTQWTWVWVNSGSWWWTGRPGMLQFTGSQTVGHDRAIELKLMCILSHVQLFVTPCSTRLLCPWNFQGKNNRVGCHFLL